MSQSENRITGILRVIGGDPFANSKWVKRSCTREGVLRVNVNPRTKKVYIDYDPSKVSWGEIRRLVGKATYQKDESK